MKLYVIRHGQTNWNKEKRYNCRYDEDINEIGIEQAIRASENIKKLNIDLIICSPMKRTKHTMELLNVNKVPVIYDDRIIERDGGKLTRTIIDDYYFTEYYNYYSKKPIEGLETLPELFNRIHSFLYEIKKKKNKKKKLYLNIVDFQMQIKFNFN